MPRPPPTSTLFPYTTLFRSVPDNHRLRFRVPGSARLPTGLRSEEHTSELQSLRHLVCRLLLEKKKLVSGGGPDEIDAMAARTRDAEEGDTDRKAVVTRNMAD